MKYPKNKDTLQRVAEALEGIEKILAKLLEIPSAQSQEQEDPHLWQKLGCEDLSGLSVKEQVQALHSDYFAEAQNQAILLEYITNEGRTWYDVRKANHETE